MEILADIFRGREKINILERYTNNLSVSLTKVPLEFSEDIYHIVTHKDNTSYFTDGTVFMKGIVKINKKKGVFLTI